MRFWVVLTLFGAAVVALPVVALAHDDLVPHSELGRSWSFEPLAVVPASAALVCFVQAWLRLRARGRRDLAGWDRLALFSAGITVILLAIVSPLDPIAEEYLQSAHMLQHVLIADLGVALVVLAVRGPLTVFFLPRAALVPLARSKALRKAFDVVLRAPVALSLWIATLVIWHVPALYEAALRDRLVHDLQHASFVIAGALVWVKLIDPTRHARLKISERIGLTVLVFWAGQILAYVIAFSPTPLFDVYARQDERLLGWSSLTDQKVAGVVMMVEQILTVGTCFVLLVRERRRTPAAGRALEHASV